MENMSSKLPFEVFIIMYLKKKKNDNKKPMSVLLLRDHT